MYSDTVNTYVLALPSSVHDAVLNCISKQVGSNGNTSGLFWEEFV
jgi:hypothetical protein